MAKANSWKKAKFLRRYESVNWGQHFIYMDYEYRGHEYTVYENLNKGNEPLSWQHRNSQADIDRLIELKEKEQNQPPCVQTVDEALDIFFKQFEI